ncbi:serine hydrolase [Tenacibaculum sp. IB213877]|uniref:serine hydrolase n=1 Tax=Tenacibaculum sp. IB213877 TaxID=3097351 RepID=UPI002A5AACBC|nr:serine hydrolase [Tenacibaculum sp. IB213877]MDY0780610.1 serine hydrolase [Tenacibaculum sp. IB213877]
MKFRVFLIVLLHTFLLTAQTTELPIKSATVLPLEVLEDESLEKTLIDEVNKNALWKKLISSNLLSIGLVDMSNSDDIKYAGINDDTMMYAASLPKIAVLLAAMDAIEKGELAYTDEIKKDLRLMISKSNNQASTRMIDRLGYEKIEEVLRAPKHKLYDEKAGGGLWVGKRYAAGGKRYPEPLKGLSHAATTLKVSSFYYQLAMGNLLSDESCREMLDIMKDPALHHKFVNTLDRIAPNATLYRKSGSWKNFHSDSILVWGPNRKYILVALVDNNLGEKIIRNLVEPIENVLKKSRSL